jgi:membrane-associated phospholipid phosphatase
MQPLAARHVATSLSSIQLEALPRALVNLAKPFSLLALFIGVFQARTVMPGPAHVGFVLLFIGLIYRALPESGYRTFTLYFAGFSLFNDLRIFADDTGIPISYSYAIRLDEAVFQVNPSAWLQQHVYQPGNLATWAAILVYTTYFFGHYFFAIMLWWFKRGQLQLFVNVVIATLFLGLAVYYVLPTAPPWLASENGNLPQVERVVPLAQNDLWSGAYSKGSSIAGRNDVAAMPSLHTALSFVIAMMAWRIGRAAGILGFAYAGAMGLCLVYLGEHYVVDVLAGAAIAAVGWRIISWAMQAHLSIGRFTVRSNEANRPEVFEVT